MARLRHVMMFGTVGCERGKEFQKSRWFVLFADMEDVRS